MAANPEVGGSNPTYLLLRRAIKIWVPFRAKIHIQLLTDCGVFYMPSNSRHGTHTFNCAPTQYLFVGSAGTRTLTLRVPTFRWRRSYRMSYPNRCHIKCSSIIINITWNKQQNICTLYIQLFGMQEHFKPYQFGDAY